MEILGRDQGLVLMRVEQHRTSGKFKLSCTARDAHHTPVVQLVERPVQGAGKIRVRVPTGVSLFIIAFYYRQLTCRSRCWFPTIGTMSLNDRNLLCM